MTNAEAIETLRANYPDACYEQLRGAVDAAIEALKQPEIIHCGECELKIECCRNIRSGGRKDDDFCSCGRRAERRADEQQL